MTPEQWERVKAIFHSAVELEGDEREAFVDRECGNDEAIMQEVASLLRSHALSSTFIEAPAFAAISKLVDDTEQPSRIGQVIGSYKIEGEIGRGGMGAVYLASRADREYDKKVAIKLIKRGFDTDEVIRRFRHERQILAALEHPNITRLLDGGSTEDGRPYLVMDYVDGRPLNEFSDERMFSIRQRLEIFLQICSAVAYAHQNLVIHRDLKPSNVLVTADGTPKLLDFGIAKLVAADGNGQTVDRTINAFQAMTPDYASPEQVAGQNVTTASDIYSLGVILYELLTGHRPFRFRMASAEEISRVLTTASPTKPSSVCRQNGMKAHIENTQAAIKTLRGDLDNIVLMAMRREPERRYSSVEQFAEDIRRYLSGRPVIAQEDTFGYRASKFIRRNKAGVGAGVGIAVSLIGGLIMASRQARIASRQRDIARREARKAEKVNQFLQKMLSSADPREAGRDVRVVEMLKVASDSVETEFARQPAIAADLHTTIGLTYLGLGQLEDAARHLNAALEIRKQRFRPDSIEVAMSLMNWGRLLHARGDLNGAEPYYQDALEILRSLGERRIELADVLNHYSYLIAMKGENERAIELNSEELRIRRKVLGEEHPDVALNLSRVANVYSVMGRYDTADRLYRNALRILRTAYSGDHPDIAQTLSYMVGTLLREDPAKAEEVAREAHAMRTRIFGSEHPEVAWSHYNLAYVLISRGRSDEAGAIVLAVLRDRGENLPDEHPVVASCYLLAGRAAMARGDFESANRAFERCLELRLRTLPENHWLLATTRTFLGESLIHLGNAAGGGRMLRENYELLRSKLGDDHEQTRQAAERLVNSLGQLPGHFSKLR